MSDYHISSFGYDFNLGEAFIHHSSLPFSAISDEHIRISADDSQREQLSASLTAIIFDELLPAEARQFTGRMELDLNEQLAVLSKAKQLIARSSGPLMRRNAMNKLTEHLRSSNKVNLGGFLCFRMRDALSMCAAAVVKAADSVIMRGEYMELISALSTFAHMQAPRMGDLSLILNADGSCTISSDLSGTRLSCDYEEKEGLISILLGLAPETIRIYDLSCGKGALLCETVSRVFRERVKLFR